MTMYCKVVGGSVVQGPRGLPKTSAEASGLNLSASIAKTLGWLPATVTEPTYDSTTHKKGARSDAITADDVTITWAVDAMSAEEITAAEEGALSSIRSQRDNLLNDSDWTILPDSPLDVTARGEWTIYRQVLRDMPGNQADVFSPVWPTAPAS